MPDGALVLRLGKWGLAPELHALFQRKQQRVLLITGENPDPAFAIPAGYDPHADYSTAFGDACVTLHGYPIPILPPAASCKSPLTRRSTSKCSAGRVENKGDDPLKRRTYAPARPLALSRIH